MVRAAGEICRRAIGERVASCLDGRAHGAAGALDHFR
jgi:hypothetical protein